MRIAIISDIHGNLIALDAVLADIDREKPDQLVCLGDVAATGAQPHEVLQRLKAQKCPVVMGNTDAFLLDPQPYTGTDENDRRFVEIDRWGAAQLTAEDQDYVRTFQPTIELAVGTQRLLGYHGSPLSNTDIIAATTPADKLESMFAGVTATLLAGGHTHETLVRRYRDKLIVNPGSVGLPFETLGGMDTAYNPGWAEYALVRWVAGCWQVELRRVPVDAGKIVAALLASGIPYADWLAKDWKRT